MAVALIVDGFAGEAVVRNHAGLAIETAPHDAAALSLGAVDLFVAKNFAMAGQLATDAIGRAPFNLEAMRTLGLVAAHDGHMRRAAALLNHGASLSWHDTPTQAWLFRQALLNNDVSAIAQRGDALLRRKQLADAVYPSLTYLTTSDDGRGMLAGVLIEQPPWRADYLRQLQPVNDMIAADIIALFDTMLLNKDVPTPHETTPFLQHLIDQGYGSAAADLSGRLTHARAGAPLIDDPDFQLASSDGDTSPFAWKAPILTSTQATADLAPDGGPALAIQEDGSGGGDFIRRYVGLAPGRYRFFVGVYADSADALERLRLRIRCEPDGDEIADSHVSAPVQGKWVPLTTRFEVPADCGAALVSFNMLGGGLAANTLYLRGARILPLG